MKKVFIIHGYEGAPNGGWRPWLMTELQKRGVYACSLSMPTPKRPLLSEWVAEISRHVEGSHGDEVYLVGHSLGVSAILRYLETLPAAHAIAGAVLVSGRNGTIDNPAMADFYAVPFDFASILAKTSKFAVVHGDDDKVVPVESAYSFSEALHSPLILIPNGGHLNGSSGCLSLPLCLDALTNMMGV